MISSEKLAKNWVLFLNKIEMEPANVITILEIHQDPILMLTTKQVIKTKSLHFIIFFKRCWSTCPFLNGFTLVNPYV